mgnify:CR=1 FL=1
MFEIREAIVYIYDQGKGCRSQTAKCRVRFKQKKKMNHLIAASELVINRDGSVYHLNIKPGELAEKIICVGDPDRVEKVCLHFDTVEMMRRKREFVSATGTYAGQRLSVISSGIGTDNMDIVLNEIDALFNIDFDTRQLRPRLTPLQFLRLGTCGGMQAGIPLGTIINSRHAIGSDGLLHFYRGAGESGLDRAFSAYEKQMGGLPFSLYTAEGDADLAQWLSTAYPEIRSGITFTASGFYGPQGRSIGRLSVAMPDLPERLAGFSYGGFSLLNMEMETSALLGLCRLLGHRAGSLCTVLANRREQTFSDDPAALVEKLILTGLDVMARWE